MATLATASLLLDRLVTATRAERRARQELRDARTAQGLVLREYHEAGIPMSVVVIRLCRALGEVVTLDERRRMAATFRQRTSRAQRRSVTLGHADHPVSHGHLPAAAPLLDRAIPPTEKEPNVMPMLVERITEKFEPDDADLGADLETDLDAGLDRSGVDKDDVDEEDERPTTRKRRR